MSASIVPDESVPDDGQRADSCQADLCQAKCCASRRSWVVLLVLSAVLAVLVLWKREAWVALLTEGEFESPHRGRFSATTLVHDVRDGFNPIVAVPRSFPPITEFPIANASDVQGPTAELQIRDNELVLGISLDGEARAYPINMLTGPQREIINDTLARTPIAATW